MCYSQAEAIVLLTDRWNVINFVFMLFSRKKGDGQTDRQTNSNFINIDINEPKS